MNFHKYFYINNFVCGVYFFVAKFYTKSPVFFFLLVPVCLEYSPPSFPGLCLYTLSWDGRYHLVIQSAAWVGGGEKER